MCWNGQLTTKFDAEGSSIIILVPAPLPFPPPLCPAPAQEAVSAQGGHHRVALVREQNLPSP